jgi:serine/threonine-protein kinase RsbW
VTGDYVLEGLAVPETLNLLHDLLEQAGREHLDLDRGDLMMFETAVIEVAGNVVEHGRPHGRVTWAFRLSVLPDRLEAQLSDSGEEYPGGTWGTAMPADLLQEDGRGLALATAVLDSLDYERSAGANHWTMVRTRA